jgi:PilZ domain
MSGNEQRHIARDSLFVMAGLRVAGLDKDFKVKIRNLSQGGLMAEGGPRVVPGTAVTLDIRNIGKVEGAVAWVQDSRCGIAFDTEIDAKAVRMGSVPTPGSEARTFRPLASMAQALTPEPGHMRKI